MCRRLGLPTSAPKREQSVVRRHHPQRRIVDLSGEDLRAGSGQVEAGHDIRHETTLSPKTRSMMRRRSGWLVRAITASAWLCSNGRRTGGMACSSDSTLDQARAPHRVRHAQLVHHLGNRSSLETRSSGAQPRQPQRREARRLDAGEVPSAALTYRISTGSPVMSVPIVLDRGVAPPCSTRLGSLPSRREP